MRDGIPADTTHYRAGSIRRVCRGHRTVASWLRRLSLVVAVLVLASCSSNGGANVQTTTTAAGDERMPFGYQTAWLAIRTEDGAAVANVLGLSGIERRNWEGVESSYRHGVFVAPSIDGWTLAVGVDLLTAPHHPNTALLSRMLHTEVQWFETEHVSETHGWARSAGGNLVREFEYVGDSDEVTANTGRVSTVERRLKFLQPDESTVVRLAAAWSVDPTELKGRDPRLGWFGTLPAP